MGTAIKHPVPDRVKPSFVIFDIRALWRIGLASESPDVKNYKLQLTRSDTEFFVAVPIWQHGRQRVEHFGQSVCFFRSI